MSHKLNYRSQAQELGQNRLEKRPSRIGGQLLYIVEYIGWVHGVQVLRSKKAASRRFGRASHSSGAS
jgi:hypothetical protein